MLQYLRPIQDVLLLIFITYSLNPVIVSTTLNQLTSPQACDGSLFLSVDSGLAPFTYIWEVNGVPDTSSNSNGYIHTI